MNKSIGEQIVIDYCNHHTLHRPEVNLVFLLSMIFLIESFVIVCSVLVRQWIGFNFFVCVEAINTILLIIFARNICKNVVKMYQRYASEETRRKCHCMPSCSEYALLALDKYFWPKALWLIYRRLTHTCCLPGYKIDYP